MLNSTMSEPTTTTAGQNVDMLFAAEVLGSLRTATSASTSTSTSDSLPSSKSRSSSLSSGYPGHSVDISNSNSPTLTPVSSNATLSSAYHTINRSNSALYAKNGNFSPAHSAIPPYHAEEAMSPVSTPSESSMNFVGNSNPVKSNLSDSNSSQSAPVNVPPSQDASILNRVTNYPLISTAVKAYETGKNYSPRFKYGAEMVENLALPVVRKVDSSISSSSWAGIGRSPNNSNNNVTLPSISSLTDGMNEPSRQQNGQTSVLPPISSLQSIPLPQQMNRTPPNSSQTSTHYQQHVTPSNRTSYQHAYSKMHTVLVNATGLAAISEESRKKLRFCLHMLKLANSHLSSRVDNLHALIDPPVVANNEQQNPQGGRENGMNVDGEGNEEGQEDESKKEQIATLKIDIVGTIKKAVTIVSNYAGNSLPEPARTHVRETLLRLPYKFMAEENRNASDSSTNTNNGDYKVLALARDSLDMLSSITKVVGETLEKAELWCDRFGKPRLNDMNDEIKEESPISENETVRTVDNNDVEMT